MRGLGAVGGIAAPVRVGERGCKAPRAAAGGAGADAKEDNDNDVEKTTTSKTTKRHEKRKTHSMGEWVGFWRKGKVREAGT